MNLNWNRNQCQSGNNDKEIGEVEAHAIFQRCLNNDSRRIEVYFFNVQLNKIY
jgi:hypothetical protein